MFSTEDFIIAVFCCVDDLWSQITQGNQVRARGFAPCLNDNEVITMEIVGEFSRIDADKGIGNYFRGHWQELFPEIKSRSAFVRRGLERLLTYGAMSSSYNNFWRESQEVSRIQFI